MYNLINIGVIIFAVVKYYLSGRLDWIASVFKVILWLLGLVHSCIYEFFNEEWSRLSAALECSSLW